MHTLIAAALGIAAAFQCPDGAPSPCVRRAAPPRMSVAVLYFTSLSRDSNDALLADGFTEELSARLSQVDSVLVRSRGLVQRFRNAPSDPIAVGRALNSAYVLSGTFRHAGDRIRVTAELARASDGAQVWADVLERSSSDLLGIGGDLASAVAGGVAGRLRPREQALLARRPTQNAAAWEQYLLGNALIVRRYAGRLPDAVAAYRSAVRLDPRFAAAWGRMAEALALLPLYERANGERRRVLEDSARGAADRAMELDSMAAESWIARGITAGEGFNGQYGSFERAVALDPRLAEAHYHLGATLSKTADAASAERHLLAARRLDPSLPNTMQRLALLMWRQGRLSEARAWFDTLVTNAPENRYSVNTADGYLDLMIRMGDTAAARAGLADFSGQPSVRDSLMVTGLLARTAAQLGDTAAARRRLRDAVPATDTLPMAFALLASAYVALGETDRALSLLERGAQVAALETWGYLRHPYFEQLRRQPRFVRLLEQTWPR